MFGFFRAISENEVRATSRRPDCIAATASFICFSGLERRAKTMYPPTRAIASTTTATMNHRLGGTLLGAPASVDSGETGALGGGGEYAAGCEYAGGFEYAGGGGAYDGGVDGDHAADPGAGAEGREYSGVACDGVGCG